MSGKKVVRDVVLVACAMVLAACGSTPVTPGGPPPPGAPTTSGGPPALGLPACGEGLDMLAATGLLTVEGRFPSSVERNTTTIAGTVTVINPGPSINGDTSPTADVYLARDGKVVATPMVKDLLAQPIDLAEGGSSDVPATGALQSCATGDPLPTGAYDVFAVVTITGGDNTLIATGGPWRLDIT